MKRESGSESSGPVSGRVAELYRQYWHELCAWLYAQFGAGPPEPEDVAQQTFVKFADLQGKCQIENPKALVLIAVAPG